MPQTPTVEDIQVTIADAEKLLGDLATLLPNRAETLNEVAAILKDLQNHPIILELLLSSIGLLKARQAGVIRTAR